jgi:hypothetical protein
MLNKIDFRFLSGAIGCFTVAGLIMFGKTGITFAGADNEMFCFTVACVMGIFMIAASGKDSK